MSKSNDNNPHLIQIPLGTQRSNVSIAIPGFYARKKMILKNASLMANNSVAGATHTVKVQIKNGSTVIGEIDTTTASEGPLDPTLAKAFPETEVEVAAGSFVKVNVETLGTGHLDEAMVSIEAYKV